MISNPMLLAPMVSLAIGLVAVRVVRGASTAIGFVDNPDRRRKLHETPIALGGGIAVWLATWSGWLAGLWSLPAGAAGAAGSTLFYAGLAVASFLILAVGVVDDRFGMRGSHKLAGQLLVAVVLVASGLRVDALGGFGVVVELGDFGPLLTVFWIVLVINAFNLIDGMDGFCGGVAFVTSVALALMAARADRTTDALIGLALAGALVAFLKDNLPPARIYLGDAGSMTLGLIFSALSIRACSGGTVEVPVSAAPAGRPADAPPARRGDGVRPPLARGPFAVHARSWPHPPLASGAAWVAPSRRHGGRGRPGRLRGLRRRAGRGRGAWATEWPCSSALVGPLVGAGGNGYLRRFGDCVS